MADRKRMLKAAVMAAPLSALAWAAHAAGPACDGDIVMAQASQDAGVPSTPHQEQVLRGKQGSEQQGAPEPSAGPSSSASQDAGVPSSPHQEQLLRGEQGGKQ